MAKYIQKMKLLKQAQEMAKMIAETEEVDFFKRAEAQINENQKVRETIASLKVCKNKQLISNIMVKQKR